MAMVENDGRGSAGIAPETQALLDAMPAPAYLCDGDGVVVARNARAAALWGDALQAGRGDEALGAAPLPAVAEDGPQEAAETEVILATAAGPRRAFASVSRLREGGSPAGLLLKSFRLAQPRDDAEDLFENGAVGLRLVAGDGTILRANQAELDLLGYRREDYVGHKLDEFDADVDRLGKVLARIRAGESVDRYPARLVGGDGRIRHVQISSSGCFRDGEFLHSRCFTFDVSEQERLNRTIRRREQLSRQLLQALPTAVFTTDTEGRITFFNDAAVGFAGCRPVLGQAWGDLWRLFRPDGTPLPRDEYPLLVALREQRPLCGATAIAERPDGSRRAFAAYPTPLFDEDGGMIGAVNMMVDVTEQQETAQALQDLNTRLEQRVLERTRAAEAAFTHLHRSERDFALLVGSVVDYAIYMLDPQGLITNWNVGAERIKGYSAEEVVGTHFSRFYTPEDRDRGIPETALATARWEGCYQAEGWRVRKDGSRFWASVVVDPIVDEGVLVGFAKITRDVTERMEAEAALVESEYLARGIIDTALDAFAQLDDDGRIVRWNPRAESLFGWPRKEAMGQPLAALIVAEPDRGRFEQYLWPAAPRAPRGASRPIEAVDRGGRRIPVELSVSSLTVNGNRHTNVFMRDLSEKILIESQLRQAQKMEAVGQLTGGLAHDFNNLLQGIIGSLDLIQLHVEEGRTADLPRFVNGALNSAERAAATTHRLLAFARRQPLDPRPVQANPLMLSMADLLQRTLGGGIALAFDLADDLWVTLCDPNQLENAVLNLSINARDAMPGGGRLLIRSRNARVDEIRASKGREAGADEYICIEVADNGAGMSAEVIERAFEPFFTTKGSGRGTGLGLSMVYGFARQSNGYCDIDSEPGQGTAIRLYLPRHAAAADEQPAPSAGRAPAVSGKGALALVVEDEDVVRQVVVEVLRQLGCEVLEATDGEAGLAALRANDAIHLLVSDIGLPDTNGRMLANMARESRPGLKVLLMTGYASDTSAPEGFAAGMELITKPFTVDVLSGRLREMLGDT